jgi:large subunit ribosomal protein L18
MRFSKQKRRKKIHQRIRRTIKGTATKPRLSVYRSNHEIYAQLIDDVNGVTIASASSRKVAEKDKPKVELSKAVGMAIAEKAGKLDIQEVAFDRSGYLYHGRVKSLAEGAREGGLKF